MEKYDGARVRNYGNRGSAETNGRTAERETGARGGRENKFVTPRRQERERERDDVSPRSFLRNVRNERDER